MKVACCFALALVAGCAASAPAPVPPSLPPGSSSSVPPVASTPDTPDEPFRAQAPDAAPPRPFQPPEPATWSLPNGARVVFVHRSETPLVTVKLLIERGCVDVASAERPSCHVAGTLMKKGTTKHGELAVGNAFDAAGASWNVDTDVRYCFASLATITSSFEATLDLLGEVIQEPSFEAKAISSYRTELQATQLEETRDLDALARAGGQWATYGAAGQGFWRILKPKQLDTVTPTAVRRVYRELFTPAAATFVVVGDLDQARLDRALSHAFGSWHATADAVPARSPRPSPIGPRIVLIDRPGATQSAVYLNDAPLSGAAPDRLAFQVMIDVLGGDDQYGRVSHNLREEKGYTYGVRATVTSERPPLLERLALGGNVQTDKTGASVLALLDEVRRMREADVTPEELARSKHKLEERASSFETSSDTVGTYVSTLHGGLPLDELAKAGRFDGVTASDVRRAAEKYLRPDAMKVVVVGDRAAVEPQLRDLKLGNLIVLDGYGDPIAGSSSALTR